ncbi:hypothetical protein [Chrysiogenes arsenatis]|uniref:hypothetical protein n=1 Tax=Chrysiogenes arsenatis TaxID=309797 RepID=UPI0004854CD0|nr:hypothetical protein [Chrysiogenes arsenatis]
MKELYELNVADQCRALGIQVGDTIEGISWHTTRLTLLWLGNEEAVWSMTHRGSESTTWSEPREVVNWYLTCRDWKKVSE